MTAIELKKRHNKTCRNDVYLRERCDGVWEGWLNSCNKADIIITDTSRERVRRRLLKIIRQNGWHLCPKIWSGRIHTQHYGRSTKRRNS